MLWWWSLKYAGDGDLSRYNARQIAVGSEWEGDEKTFLDALIQAGFVDDTDGKLSLHDWYDYAGKLIERRRLDRERKRQARDAAKDDTGTADTCPSYFHGTSGGQRTDSLVPNLTVPNHTRKEKISLGGAKKTRRDVKAEAAEVLSYLNEKTGSHYQSTDEILKCLRRRHTVAECREVIDYLLTQQWAIEGKYIDTKTPFRKANFAGYLDKARNNDGGKHGHRMPGTSKPRQEGFDSNYKPGQGEGGHV